MAGMKTRQLRLPIAGFHFVHARNNPVGIKAYYYTMIYERFHQ
jgi:hypothetical protein